jgi:hypothetical protein
MPKAAAKKSGGGFKVHTKLHHNAVKKPETGPLANWSHKNIIWNRKGDTMPGCIPSLAFGSPAAALQR